MNDEQENPEEQENLEEQETPEEQKAPVTQEGPIEVKGMKELVEFIAKSIVNEPGDVVVTEDNDEQGIVLKLQVADEDKGRIIGRQGRVAQAMRTLIRVKAAKAGTRATLEIL
jgi:predicted RNA-binding protein YlqC (UPF0109 family)